MKILLPGENSASDVENYLRLTQNGSNITPYQNGILSIATVNHTNEHLSAIITSGYR